MYKNSPKVQALVDKLNKKKESKKATKGKKPTVCKEIAYIPNLTGNHPSRATMQQEADIKFAKKREEAINASPNLAKLRQVRIDSRTSIYIDRRKSPEKARQVFLMRQASV